MRRFLLLATVAALMAVMVVVSAAPVLAHNDTCVGGPGAFRVDVTPGTFPDEDNDGVVCGKTKGNGDTVFRDDHGFPNGH